jgi:transposase
LAAQVAAFNPAPRDKALHAATFKQLVSFVKTNRSDYIDAEAIAEAAGRPRMRFVLIKSDVQLDMQSLHRAASGG